MASLTQLQKKKTETVQKSSGDRYLSPVFIAEDIESNMIDLQRELQDSRVFLTFMRHVSCPVSNYRSYELYKRYPEFEKRRIKVIAIYESRRENLLVYRSRFKLPYTIISDNSTRLFNTFGVESSTWRTTKSRLLGEVKEKKRLGKELFDGLTLERDGDNNRMPADFMIEKDGTISVMHFGKNIGDHMPLEKVLM